MLHCGYLLLTKKRRTINVLLAGWGEGQGKGRQKTSYTSSRPLDFPNASSSSFCLAAKELSFYLVFDLLLFFLYYLGLLFLFMGPLETKVIFPPVT